MSDNQAKKLLIIRGNFHPFRIAISNVAVDRDRKWKQTGLKELYFKKAFRKK